MSISAMNNPQMFAQMLQQQGGSPQSNLINNSAQQPPMPAPASAQQMMQRPPAMQQPPLQQPGMAQPRPPVATPQNPAGGIDHQAQAAKLLNQVHMLEAKHGSPKPGSKEAAQLNQLKSVLLNGASGGKTSPKPTFTPQEAAALGRMGDSTVVHMTPGEMTVPKELQTPEMLAMMQREYAKKGVSPEQFKVGSPHASVNPKTGLQEFSFWSSFLPIAAGVAGGVFGGPAGAAAGSMIGGLVSGKSLGDSLMSGAMAGIGGYGLGSFLGTGSGALGEAMSSSGSDAASAAASDAAASGASDAAASGATDAGASGATASTDAAANYAAASPQAQVALDAQTSNPMADSLNISGNGAAPPPTANQQLFGRLTNGSYAAGIGGGFGSYLGDSMYQPQASPNANPTLPPGFNTPRTDPNTLPSARTLLGQTSNRAYQAPTFQGYNPNSNYTAAYNFYPSAGQSTNASPNMPMQQPYNNYPAA